MGCQYCHVRWLGKMEFKAAWNLQKEMAARRLAQKIPDTLLLMEHPPAYTAGFEGHREHLLIGAEEMVRRDISYYEVDRSGPIIYHGPGQLVGYPILNLRECGYSYHDYIRLLEKVIIHALSAFNIRAVREPGRSGVWVVHSPISDGPHPNDEGVAMIATIGVNVDKRHITRHGFFVNVNLNPEHFDLIVPYGFKARHTTSLQRVLNKPVETRMVIETVVQSFSHIFNMELVESQLTMASPTRKQPIGV